MDQPNLERRIKEIRYHLTRSLTRLSEFSSRRKIKENQPLFYRKLHEEYKIAQELLISAYLEVEQDIQNSDDKSEVAKKKYWKMVLELCFNTFVWIAERWDRDRVKRVFKGPKHGSITSRNVGSVLKAIRLLNKRWNDFAIALDFSSFECITDVIRVRINPKSMRISMHYIEVKEGTVNSEMLETIRNRSQNAYFAFFDKYGERGIKQMERYFRQGKVADERIEIMRADEGGVFDIPDGKLFVQLPSIPRMHYVKSIKELLRHLKTEPFGCFVVDNCLWVGAARVGEPRQLQVADFLVRHSVHHFLSDECDMCSNREGWQKKLADLKIFDGLRMFGSVIFEGLISKPISDKNMLDILFGRIRFFYYLDGDHFVDLCKALGLDAGYSSEREFRRWRSRGGHHAVDFGRKLLWIKNRNSEAIMYVADGMLHDVCLNWVHPYWWARQHLDRPLIPESADR